MPFEEAGIKPDLVCLSKSISGYGLPMSLVLIRPEIDIWQPGEHTGTFRGNNLAFVTATEALAYWENTSFSRAIAEKSIYTVNLLRQITDRHDTEALVRGRGLIQAIVFAEAGLAERVSQAAFKRGLIIETCGSRDESLKLLPPLTISREELEYGISVIAESLDTIQTIVQVDSIAHRQPA
ncbi:MAG TPA: aminotransferase class III-fold pyridoxal phosphate-dependent enzyme [Candidatus Angelobacter sp.]|nr:aminotransferase class III-fold pyridoxal phosphate-dependent enzyme [Candidatus Angelobacter sp.]